MNYLSEKTELNEGDCFYYKSNDEKLNIGFILLSKKKLAKDEFSLQFILVELDKDKSLNSFLNGSVYTNTVWEGLDKKKSHVGIYTLSFEKESIQLLDNFIYVDKIKLDRSKFIPGSQSSALFIERAFLLQIKNTDKALIDSRKIKVKDLLI